MWCRFGGALYSQICAGSLLGKCRSRKSGGSPRRTTRTCGDSWSSSSALRGSLRLGARPGCEWKTPKSTYARTRKARDRSTKVSRRVSSVYIRAHAQGKGVLILTGHLGNWELAAVGGIGNFSQYRGQFHIVRRPLNPPALDRQATRRFRRAGLGVLPKKGALDRLLDRLAAGDAVVVILDQYAGGRDGVVVDFFGHPTGTFRSLAILALATGAPVVPLATWREPDGHHILRFEEALPPIECEDANEAIRANTRAYNATPERLILRHPEQWFWVHRRWKSSDQNRSAVS